ncbi:hypothetical protein ACFOPQ_03390 [Deinococcus antarcticus]|uniref:Uncharacterized protein n=1 Tax=Deinococcus antarcticus TaxID=1298767 RepID=A0ABV8A2C1_9DEIO
MKKAALLAALFILPAALPTALAAPVTLTLNGQPTTLNTTVLGGKTYILLDDLKKALTGAGGANQKASVEGCVGEWLFNGIVRMRVTKVEVTHQDKGDTYPGYAITAEFKNGVNETITLDDVGLVYNNAKTVTFADGNSWSDSRAGGWQDKTYAKIQQGGGTVMNFRIYSEEQYQTGQAVPAPQKFLVEVKNKSGSTKARYTVPDPSFRVNLTCRK